MPLSDCRTLGRSGLVVSPVSLGTMTFGAQRWGSSAADSQDVFDAYVEGGGNFVDTADVYSGGRSEEMIGSFVDERKLRHRLVLATKAGFARETGYPHAGGNGAKNINTALEGSLRRLRTDYVDLFWIHVWDMVTPAEEVLQTVSALIRAGKARYYGISNAPAWYVAKLATLATAHGLPAPIALQYEHSLVERSIEREHVPAAKEFGLGIMPWSPLGGGFLTGKYKREDFAGKEKRGFGDLPTGAALPDDQRDANEGRLSGANPFGDTKFNDHNWRVLDVLRTVAGELRCAPAQAALAWATRQPGISSLILGASRVEQLTENTAGIDLDLTSAQMRKLDDVSALPAQYPYAIFTPTVNRMVFGGATVRS